MIFSLNSCLEKRQLFLKKHKQRIFHQKYQFRKQVQHPHFDSELHWLTEDIFYIDLLKFHKKIFFHSEIVAVFLGVVFLQDFVLSIDVGYLTFSSLMYKRQIRGPSMPWWNFSDDSLWNYSDDVLVEQHGRFQLRYCLGRTTQEIGGVVSSSLHVSKS